MTSTPSRGLHHVAIFAPDFDKAVAFYTETFGMTPACTWGEAPKRAVMLDAGKGDFVEIFERPDRGEVPTGMGVSLAMPHLALRVDDVPAVLAKVEAAGLKTEMAHKTVPIANGVTGETVDFKIAFFTGPSGELVELFGTGAP
jgi:glyoxylase I family protein